MLQAVTRDLIWSNIWNSTCFLIRRLVKAKELNFWEDVPRISMNLKCLKLKIRWIKKWHRYNVKNASNHSQRQATSMYIWEFIQVKNLSHVDIVRRPLLQLGTKKTMSVDIFNKSNSSLLNFIGYTVVKFAILSTIGSMNSQGIW